MSAIELSKPAMLAAVSYLVMAFVVLLPLEGSGADKKDGGFGKRLMTVVLMLIPIALSIYSINCMVVGKCIIWSWVNSVVIALWVLLFLVAIVLSTERKAELVKPPYMF